MERNVFLVRWYGPFKSVSEVQDWEAENGKTNLYLIHGKKYKAKNKESYYCGMSMRTVGKRFVDANHHIKEVENRISSIYIGKIVNKPTRKCDVALVERLLTAYVYETLPSYAFNSDVINETNYSKPKSDVYLINEWRSQDTDIRHKRNKALSPAQLIPDILVYSQEEDAVRGALHLKELIRY